MSQRASATLDQFDPTLTEAQKKRIRSTVANWLLEDYRLSHGEVSPCA